MVAEPSVADADEEDEDEETEGQVVVSPFWIVISWDQASSCVASSIEKMTFVPAGREGFVQWYQVSLVDGRVTLSSELVFADDKEETKTTYKASSHGSSPGTTETV